jgi:hypothetical protein
LLLKIKKEGVCDTCIITKHCHAPFLALSKYGEEATLDLFHGDLCGMIMLMTPGG